MRNVTVLTLLVVAITTACSGVAEPATTSGHAAPTTTVLDPSGCPVADQSFCAVAADVGNALAAGDIDRLLALSRVDKIVCADVAVEYFPDCTSGGVLEGHGVSDASQLVELVGDGEYQAQLEEALGALDPTYSDEHGAGAVRLLGVGTCGPEGPGRRSYHVAWDRGHGPRRRHQAGNGQLRADLPERLADRIVVSRHLGAVGSDGPGPVHRLLLRSRPQPLAQLMTPIGARLPWVEPHHLSKCG